MNKSRPAKPCTGPDEGPWIDLGNGKYRSASTGRQKYDPNQDPRWRADIQRIQAAEAATQKKKDDALRESLDWLLGNLTPKQCE